jgi:hypothetical protein
MAPLDIREKLAHIDQKLAEHDRERLANNPVTQLCARTTISESATRPLPSSGVSLAKRSHTETISTKTWMPGTKGPGMTNFDEPRRARAFCRLDRSTVGPRLAHGFEVFCDTLGETVGDDPGNLGKRLAAIKGNADALGFGAFDAP